MISWCAIVRKIKLKINVGNISSLQPTIDRHDLLRKHAKVRRRYETKQKILHENHKILFIEIVNFLLIKSFS